MRLSTRWLFITTIMVLAFASPVGAATLNDGKLGKTKTELQRQVRHSQHVIAFFTDGKGRWMPHRRHKTCWSVIGSGPRKVCRKSRTLLRGHRWLHATAIERLEAMLAPTPSGAGLASATATWYGPGFYNHSTSCGQILTTGSMWTASMTYGCGTKVTICTSTCIRTTVQDTGAFSATFDLAPGLASALGCYCTQTVRWRLGW